MTVATPVSLVLVFLSGPIVLQIILDTYFNVELDVPMRKPTEDSIMALMHFSVALLALDCLTV